MLDFQFKINKKPKPPQTDKQKNPHYSPPIFPQVCGDCSYANTFLSSYPLVVAVRALIILVASEWSCIQGCSKTQEHLAVCMHAPISTAFSGVRRVEVYGYQLRWVI